MMLKLTAGAAIAVTALGMTALAAGASPAGHRSQHPACLRGARAEGRASAVKSRFRLFGVTYRHRDWLTGMASGPSLTHPIRGLDTAGGLRLLLRRWAVARSRCRRFGAVVTAVNHLYPPAVHARVYRRLLHRHRGREVWGAFARQALLRRITVAGRASG